MHNLTEPSASMTMPGDESSGLWLWHGAPPNEGKQQKISARRVRWFVIVGVLLVAALSSLAGFILRVPIHPSPAEPAVSSPATSSSNLPRSLPAAAVSLPPVADVQRRDPRPEAIQRGDPTPEVKQPLVSAPAAPAASHASAPSPAKPSAARHHRHRRERVRTPLTQLFMSPAFRKGVLSPVPDR